MNEELGWTFSRNSFPPWQCRHCACFEGRKSSGRARSKELKVVHSGTGSGRGPWIDRFDGGRFKYWFFGGCRSQGSSSSCGGWLGFCS